MTLFLALKGLINRQSIVSGQGQDVKMAYCNKNVGMRAWNDLLRKSMETSKQQNSKKDVCAEFTDLFIMKMWTGSQELTKQSSWNSVPSFKQEAQEYWRKQW